ncbi:TPA: hypothetical protein N0F65_007713 [Lagenidium giganteum]|uniref:Glycylpeptide N-tetradecanoyltransferase n=1 Tax=Lagenidium giganteum TaxID=4803 RepID=A0AAV2Z5D3_9STRA|nr:TPA: hypothetical protein N0F65_007713 [Lagenidium giganteum]
MSSEEHVEKHPDEKEIITVEEQEEFLRVLKQLNLVKPPKPAPAAKKEYKFWQTQPVPGIDEFPEDHAPIDAPKSVNDVRQEPYQMPPGFLWDEIDLTVDEQVNEVYELLTQNYVEDDDNMFRFDYSPDFLKWALTPPGFLKNWHIGVRNAKNNKLMAFISGVPAKVRVYEKTLKMAEINFLCVHKKLRTKRLAPVLIREITRRVNLKDIWQAVYTAGVLLPMPVAKCRYFHRSLNPKKLIEVGFSPLPPRMTMTRMVKMLKLPDQTATPGFRPMQKKDVQQVTALLKGYVKKFKLVVDMDQNEVAHWMLPRDGVVSSFVVENPSTKKITDVCSFYHLPSTIIGNDKYKTLRAAYSYYNVATSVPLTQLMQDALIMARNTNFDVFNALSLMDNMEFLQELKFGPGSGDLHYYLYNWRCPRMTGDQSTNAHNQQRRPKHVPPAAKGVAYSLCLCCSLCVRPIMAEEGVQLLKRNDHGFDPTDPAACGVKPYGTVITLAMTLNYIIGTGCFGLPFAFMQAGIVLTSSILVVGALGALVTMNYTLESLARAEGVCAATRGGGPLHRLTYRKFDFSMVGEMFAGKVGKVVVQIVMALYGIGTLWSYASVFASSVASIFFEYVLGDKCDAYAANVASGCLDAYYINMVIFAVIVISMVLLDISEQASIQKFLTAYRILALFIMLVTMLIKMGVDGGDAIAARYAHIGAFNWANFGKGFGPTILALNCHYNMPDALQPLNPKSVARKVAFGSLIIAGSFYLLIGILGALAFDEINPLASLMWGDYTGCGNGWSKCASTNPIGTFIHIMILVFPIVNVTSAYPMVGVTIGDNILLSMPKAFTAPLGPTMARNACRLLVAVPPLLLAVFFKKLDFIFSVAGLFGFLLGLSIPCWFQVVGSRYCQRVWGFSGASITPFTVDFISSIGAAATLLAVSLVITAVAIATLNA